jgi:hypothetical protein
MLHLDDGVIAELIDGELDEAARAAATAHLAACVECRTRHAETLAYSGESDRLIAAVGLPRPVRPLRSTPAPAPLPRRIPWRTLGWAASIVMATGIGYYAGVPRPGSPSGVADARVSANQQATGTEENRPSLAAEAEGPARRNLPAKEPPASPAPTETEMPREAAAKRATQPAPAEAPLATDPLRERDRAQPPSPQAGAVTSAQDRSGRRDESSELKQEAVPGAKMLGLAAAGAPHTGSMEEAVTRLGGSIRLIDGMAPVAVRFIASSTAPGADAGAETVRVVYLDPPARELWLDQRRIDTGDEQAGRADGLLVGDTIAAMLADGRRSLRWRDAGGFQLLLAGFLGADSLQVLARKVR